MPEDVRSPGADGVAATAARQRASLLHGGRRVVVPAEGLVVGRGREAGLQLAGDRVSREHARIEVDGERHHLVDLGSRHGTVVNGRQLLNGPHELANGDTIEIGAERIRFLSGSETRMASRQQPVLGVQTVAFTGERLTIGRDAANDVVLADPNVSRFHAEVVPAEGGVDVVDLGSRNGTRVDGRLTDRARLGTGSELGIGPYRLLFDGATFLARDDHGALRLDAHDVEVAVGAKRILAPLSVSIEPGQLVAIIGESGAGKSTLLKALAGVTRPTGGRVTVNGEPVEGRGTDIGYVPQDDIVHRLLSVREAHRYAARLRLPADASGEEVEASVDRVLGELGLEEHEDTLIGSLSGGQRKRAGVGTELLSRPSLLFLDEPTTGLDPALETRLMALLRELADRSRGVALVTHATKNLALCDRVVVMARGGTLAFQGSPREALAFFGADDYDGIYDALERAAEEDRDWAPHPASDGNGRVVAVPAAAAEESTRAPSTRVHRTSGVLAQTSLLTGRYLRLLLRDRRNLALLLLQAPILGLLNIALFRPGVFDVPGGNPGDAIQFLFLMSIVIVWFGLVDSAREIIKERSVFERERMVGMRLSAYVLSKLIVLFGLISVQAVANAGVSLAFRPLDEPAGPWLAIFAVLIVTGFVSVVLGLVVSAAVSSEDQAMSVIPLVIIPQLLFAGTIVPPARLLEPAHSLVNAIFSQWSLATAGTAIDMNARMAASPEFARFNRYGTQFFDVSLAQGLLVLAGFGALFVLALVLLLRRRPGS